MSSILENYLVQILEATKATGTYAYRGQGNSHWLLHSGATRQLIGEYGDAILQAPDFPQLFVRYHSETLIEPGRTRGFGSEEGRRLSDLELLAKLQHFGAATGLLDFTWNPLVALWVACECPSTDGKLYVVNTNDPIRFTRVSSEETDQVASSVFSVPSGPPLLSYWEPTVSGDASPRILRQRSVFIIGRPLVPTDQETTKDVLIAKEDKPRLLHELETLDVYQDSLFPDIFGFAQASKKRPLPQLTSGEYTRLGNQHYQRREYSEAMTAYSEAIKLAPETGMLYLLRGNAYAASGSHQAAIDDYDIVIRHIDRLRGVAPDAVYFNRGNSKAELKDYQGAILDYTEAIRINPSLPAYHYNCANAYVDRYRFDKALPYYDAATGNVMNAATFNKGNALLAIGKLSEARDCFNRAFANDPGNAGFRTNLFTSDRFVSLVDGLEFNVTAEPDPVTGGMCLQFTLPDSAKDVAREPGTLLLVGNAGNVGNSGGPGLSGGQGSPGKPLTRILVDFADRDGQ